MPIPRGSRWFITLALAALSAAPSSATVLVGADLGELVRDARAIARGRVSAIESRWTDNHRGIETLVTVQVERYLKGSLGDTVQFRVPGGTLGRFRSIVVGAPTFADEDYVIVFLGARGPAIPYIVGFSQGVFRVVRAADDAGWVVTPPPVFPSAATTRVVRGDAARRPLALAAFEERVRTLAGVAP